MPRKPLEIEDKLKNKFGFTEAKAHLGDHRWYELRLDGLPVILNESLTFQSRNRIEA